MAFAFQPPKMRIPSGSVQPGWTGIIAVSQMARAYWPSKKTTGLPPLCASADSLNGWLADEPDKEHVKIALRQDTRHPALVYLDEGCTDFLVNLGYGLDAAYLEWWKKYDEGCQRDSRVNMR